MKRLCIVCGLLLASFQIVSAQGFDTSPEGRNGRHLFGSYFDADIDSIDVYNGNVMLDITLFAQPGRELSTGLRVSYNSKRWQPSWNGAYAFYTGGWRVHNVTGEAFIDLIFMGCLEADPDIGIWRPTGYWRDSLGVLRSYFGSDFEGVCDQENPPYENLTLYPQAGDGSVLFTGSGGLADLRLQFKDGSILDMTGSYPRTVTPNGNYLDRDYPSGLAVQDTLGRTIAYSTNRGANTPSLCDFTLTSPVPYYKSYTITDSNGQPQTFTLTFWNNNFVLNPYEACWEHLDDRLMSIGLPNGQQYTFEYEHWQGYLTKVNLPSGGYIAYDYEGGNQNGTPGEDYIFARRVSADGSAEKVWYYPRTSNNPARAIDVKSPEGPEVRHTFNSSGQEIETHYYNDATSSPIQIVSTTWTDGRPTQIDTTLGSAKKRTTIAWNASSNPIQREDSDWFAVGGSVIPLARTTYSYTSTSRGDLVSSVGIEGWDGSAYAAQGLTEFVYDEYSLSSTAGVPNKTAAPHADRGNLTTVRGYRDAGNYIEEHLHYDDVGNVVEHVDPLGRSTTISFADSFSDSANRNSHAYPTLITNAEGHQAATVYDYRTGLVVSQFDPRGLATSLEYDWAGRVTQSVSPGRNNYGDDLVVSHTYDDVNRKVTTVADVLPAALGSETRQAETIFDGLYRVIRTVDKDPGGNVTVDTEYDGNGRVKKVSAPYRSGDTVAWTETAYDGLNRAVTITNPDSTAVQFSYADNTVATTDEAGNSTRRWTNSMGQLIRVDEPNPTLSTPLTTFYTYSLNGMTAVYQYSSSPSRTFIYDWFGRLWQETHPESGTTVHWYDATRNVSRTDARGVQASYTYDDIDRILTISYNDGTPAVTFSYDQNGYTGLLTSVTDGAGSTAFTYHPNNMVEQESRTLSGVSGTFTTSYDYYMDGQLMGIVYPTGRTIQYARRIGGGLISDSLSSVAEVGKSPPLLTGTVYNAAGQLTARTWANGVEESRNFNSRFQLTGISAALSSTVLLDMDYGYGTTNNNGRIRSRVDSLQAEHSVSYSYDPLQRLSGVSGTNWGITWGFDAFGNRMSQIPTGAATSKVGTQTSGYGNNRNIAFSYDAAGNVTNDTTHNYAYDGEGRIKSVNGGATTYGYDYAGRRVRKTTGSVSTYYFYGSIGLLSEFTTTDTGATHAASTDRYTYRVPEQTGTGVLLLDSAGAVVENNRVLPYGELWSGTTGSTNDENFTTYKRDDETGLDYAMARFYASRSGRFMSPDPGHVGTRLADPQSWNAYAYSRTDPINYVDPAGTHHGQGSHQCDYDTCLDVVTTDPLWDLWDLFDSFRRRWSLFGGASTGGIARPVADPFDVVVSKTRDKVNIKLDNPSKSCSAMFEKIDLEIADFLVSLNDPAIGVFDASQSMLDAVSTFGMATAQQFNGVGKTVQQMFRGASNPPLNGLSGPAGIYFRNAAAVNPARMVHEYMHQTRGRIDSFILTAFKSANYLVPDAAGNKMVPINLAGVTGQIDEVVRSQCGF